eukprot:5282107-Amphidinium_carterae.1
MKREFAGDQPLRNHAHALRWITHGCGIGQHFGVTVSSHSGSLIFATYAFQGCHAFALQLVERPVHNYGLPEWRMEVRATLTARMSRRRNILYVDGIHGQKTPHDTEHAKC